MANAEFTYKYAQIENNTQLCFLSFWHVIVQTPSETPTSLKKFLYLSVIFLFLSHLLITSFLLIPLLH